MADISDVSDALVDIILKQFYPEGLGGPAPDFPVKVYSGWPDRQQLDKDLNAAAGFPIVHISVFAMDMERRTTRYGAEWEEDPRPTKTYEAGFSGQVVTITGGPPEPYYPQNAAVVVDARGFSRRIRAGETAEDVAGALALDIATAWPGTTSILNTIIIPAPARITAARVGIVGSAQRELARQEKAFRISIWADRHETRVWAAKKVVPALAESLTFPLADGSSAYMVCRSNTDFDRAADHVAFRRDLVYTVEYATTQEVRAPELIVARSELQDPQGATIGERDF